MFKIAQLLLATTAALVGCGGGGGGSPTSSTPGAVTPPTVSLTVTGTAATGLAIAGAAVTGKCKVGTGAATTLANGTFTLTVADGQLPCILQITNPTDVTKLHTLVAGSGNTAVANITPLTEMITASVLGSEPNIFFAVFDALAATQKVTMTNIATAQTAIKSVFTSTIDITGIANFITTPLVAATQGSPNSGDTHDKLLDALKIKLTTAQLAVVTTALTGNQTVDAIKQIVVSLTTAPTTPPVANAGAAQSVVAGSTVTLDASLSSVAQGKSLIYDWTLLSKPLGSNANLAASSTAKPTFFADVTGSYIASVIVSDGKMFSSAASVIVTASIANAAPVANAGIAQKVAVGSVVTLDGSTSSDANSDPLTYNWILTSKPTGSAAGLSSATSVRPTFNADLTGSYVATLTVNDGKVNSNVAAVSITASVAKTDPAIVYFKGSYTYPESYSFAYVDTLTGGFLASQKVANPSNSYIARTSRFIMDPAGKFVYVSVEGADPTKDKFLALSVDPKTGVLSETGFSFLGRELAINSSGTIGYVLIGWPGMTGIVATYSINPTTGVFTYTGNSVVGSSMSLDPANKFLYVTKSGNTPTISSYVTSNNGLLTLAGLPIAGDTINFDSLGKYALVQELNGIERNKISSYIIDPINGALTSSGVLVTTGATGSRFKFGPTGKFGYVEINTSSNSYVYSTSPYSINADTGVLTLSGSPAPGYGITFDSSGKYAYVINGYGGPQSILSYTVSALTGALTPSGSSVAGDAISIDPTGKFAYINSYNVVSGINTISPYVIASGVGSLTLTGSPVIGSGIQTYDFSGKIAYVVDGENIKPFIIDRSSGALTAVGSVIKGTAIIKIVPM